MSAYHVWSAFCVSGEKTALTVVAEVTETQKRVVFPRDRVKLRRAAKLEP